jgi:hypothetical protein
MTRETLLSAIDMGLNRARQRQTHPDKWNEHIADAIEIALDIEQRMFGKQPHTPEPAEMPPPNPVSLADPEEISEAHPPQPGDAAPSVIIADEAALNAALNERSKSSDRPGVKLKSSLFMGGRQRARVGMEALTIWANQNFPRDLDVIPNGIEKKITLRLEVRPYPCVGDGRKNEFNSTVKVTYKHPNVSSDLEVGESICVGDVQESMPDVDAVIGRIRKQAQSLYASRPKMIEGRAERGPTLQEQFGQARATLQNKKFSANITVIDSEDTRLERK